MQFIHFVSKFLESSQSYIKLTNQYQDAFIHSCALSMRFADKLTLEHDLNLPHDWIWSCFLVLPNRWNWRRICNNLHSLQHMLWKASKTTYLISVQSIAMFRWPLWVLVSLNPSQDSQSSVLMCVQMPKSKPWVSRFNWHSDIIQDLFTVILIKTLVSRLKISANTRWMIYRN